MSKNTIINSMPSVGDTVQRTVHCYPLGDYNDAGTVIYANVDHMFYTVRFLNGICESYTAIDPD